MRTKEQIQKYLKEWRLKNKDYITKYNKDYSKKWFQENKIRLKPIRDKWEKENPMKRYEITHRYLKKNKEKLNKNAEWFRKTYPDIVSGRLKKYRGTDKGRFNTYKSSARRRGLEIGITYNDYLSIIKKTCIYCGETNRIGLDRINNNLGYVKTNIEPCCIVCNMMKKTLDKQNFLDHIEKIYQFNKITKWQEL